MATVATKNGNGRPLSFEQYKKLRAELQQYLRTQQAKDPEWQAWMRLSDATPAENRDQLPPSPTKDYAVEWLNKLPPAVRADFSRHTADSKSWTDDVGKVLKVAIPLVVGGAALAPMMAGGLGAGGVSAGAIEGAVGLPELGLATQTGLGGIGADAATSAAWASGAGLGGDTMSAMGLGGTGAAGTAAKVGGALTTAGKAVSPFVSALTSKSSGGSSRGGSGKVSEDQEDLSDAQLKALYDQLGFSKEQFDYLKGLSDKQYQLGLDQFDWQRGLAEDAKARTAKYDALYDETTGAGLRNFTKAVNAYDTGAERDKIAGRSMVDIEEAMARGRAGMGRDFAARGLNMGSPAAITALMDSNMQGALAKGAAATMAQEAARREGLSLRQTAAGLGQPNANVATDSAGQASNFGMTGLQGANLGLTPSFANVGLYNQGQNTAIGWGNSATNNFNSMNGQNTNPWYKNLNYGQGIGGALAGFANNGGWGAAAGGLGGLLSGW